MPNPYGRPDPYDAWLNDVFGDVGGDFELPAPWTPPPAPVKPPKPKAPPKPAEPPMEDWQRYGGMAARGIGGLLGFTPWTGAAGGAGGEIVAEMIEQKDLTPELNIPRIIGEGAAGAVGGGFAKMLGAMAGAPIKAGIAGAMMGGAAPILRHGFGEGDWDPRNYPGEVALSGGLSGATGAGAAWLTGIKDFGRKVPTAVSKYEVETTAVPGGRGYQGGHLRTDRAGQAHLEGAKTGINQPVSPVEGTGAPIKLKEPLPNDPEVEPSVPYVGMPSITQKQQRMIETEQREFQKLEDMFAKADQTRDANIQNQNAIAEGMASEGLTEADVTRSFGRSTTAKDAAGRTLRMSERFAKEEADDAAKTATQTGPTGPDVEPADDLESIRAEIERLRARETVEGGAVLPSTAPTRDPLKALFRANPPMRSQAVGVEGPPPPVDPLDEILGGITTQNRRGRLREELGAYPPARSQAVGVGNPPEAPLPGPLAGEIPPSGPIEAPPAPSGLAKALSPKKGGKRASKSKVTKFDEAVQKTLGAAEEAPVAAGVPVEPLPAPVAELPVVEGEVSPLTFHPGSRADIARREYDALQALLKANPQKLERELHDKLTSGLSQTAPLAQGTRLAGAALRREGTAASKGAPKAAGKLEEMLGATPKAPEAPPAPATSWIDEENAEIARLSALPPEARLQAFLEGGEAATKPAILAETSTAEPDWVAQAMKEVEGLESGTQAANKAATQAASVEQDVQKAVQGATATNEAAAAKELSEVSELAKLLKASGAIKNESEIGSWLTRLQKGEDVMPAGPPPEPPPAPPAPPTAGKASRGRLRAQGAREEAPLPQDYSPTPAGKPGKAPKAAPATAAVGPKAPFSVIVGGEGGAGMASQDFNTIEEAEAFLGEIRKTGKFDKMNPRVVDNSKKPTDLKPRLNKVKKGKEAGFSELQMLSSILGGTGGALAGAASDEEDPIRGGLLGAVGGAAAGAALPAIAQGLVKLGSDPKTVGPAIEKLQQDGNTHKAAATITKTLPQWVRFNYLMDAVGLPANAGAGPWGSGLMGSMEKWLSGDQRGRDAFVELLNPWTFLKEIRESYPEAASLVGRAEGFALSEASSNVEKTLSFPGTIMTAGDVAIRRILQRHGFSDDEARIMTLTSEPFTRTGESGAHLRGLGWDITFPFKRTPINIAEQGMLRTPGIGSVLQGVGAARGTRAADPLKTQLVQQAMGAGVGLGAEQIGENLTPEQAKYLRRYISNAAGPYSLLASLGFGVGQARARGVPSPAKEAVRTLPYNLPMPSLEPVQDALTFALDPEFKQLPRGAYPAAAYEQLKEALTPEPTIFRRRRR